MSTGKCFVSFKKFTCDDFHQTVRFQGHSLIEEDPGVTFEEGNTIHDIIWFDIQESFSSLFILNFESLLFIDNNCLIIIVIFPSVEESVDDEEDCVTAKIQTWTGIQKEVRSYL